MTSLKKFCTARYSLIPFQLLCEFAHFGSGKELEIEEHTLLKNPD